MSEIKQDEIRSAAIRCLEDMARILETDPDIFAETPLEEIRERLRERGLESSSPLPDKIRKIISNSRNTRGKRQFSITAVLKSLGEFPPSRLTFASAPLGENDSSESSTK